MRRGHEVVSRTGVKSLLWSDVLARYEGFRNFVSNTARPPVRVFWPIVFLIVAIAAFAKATTAKDLADIIQALASLAWPGAAITIAYWFRAEIRALLSRVRKGKGFGFEFELEELREKTEAAEVRVEGPQISGELNIRLDDARLSAEATAGTAPTFARAGAQDAIEEVLRDSTRSPRLGLMLLSAKIDRAAWELGQGLITLSPKSRAPTLREMVRQLVQIGMLPVEAAEALELFQKVRNRIVHGHDADDDEVAGAIDSRTRLLRLLLLIRPEPEPPSG